MKTIILFTAGTILFSLASHAIYSQDSENLELIGKAAFGNPEGIFVQNNYVYIAACKMFSILDITNPEELKVIGYADIPTHALAEDIFVNGQYAYIAASLGGLRIFDISNPYKPVEVGVGNVMEPRERGALVAKGVHVADGYAYVANFSCLSIYDISNPSSPTEIGYIEVPGDADQVYVKGQYAYIAEGHTISTTTNPGTLRIIDISDPTNPTEVGNYVTNGDPSGIIVEGNYAYVADGYQNPLRIIDVSEPASPYEVGSFHPSNRDTYSAGNVCLSGHYILVSDPSENSGIWIVDIANPEFPVEASFYPTIYIMQDCFAVGSTIITAFSHGIRIIDINEPQSPQQVSYIDSPASARSIIVRDNFAFITNWINFSIYDIQNPASPIKTGEYQNKEMNLFSCDLKGINAYITDLNSGLLILDITNPSFPVQVGYFDTPGVAWDICIDGNYAYLADGRRRGTTDQNGYLRIIDISDPSSPKEISTYSTPGHMWGVVIEGDYAFVAVGQTAGTKGMVIVDISDPSLPTEVGYYNLSFVENVFVSGNYAYLTCWGSTGKLVVVDISDPTHPSYVSQRTFPSTAEEVYVQGNLAYVSCLEEPDNYGSKASVRIIDVSDPKNGLTEEGYYYTPGEGWGVYARDKYVYIADPGSGFWILQYTGSVGIEDKNWQTLLNGYQLSQNYPNPFNTTTTINYSLAKKEYVVIKIYNINGREVKKLLEQEQSRGEYSITWNGKDSYGKFLPSGLYFYRIKAGEFKKSLKMSLIK